ncbi:MAG: hypothetical protein ACE5GJ_07690 [Gemmatimonadota bacterium]
MKGRLWRLPAEMLLLGVLVAASAATPAAAQVTVRDFVITMGGSVEAYSGNFSAVTVPVVDSTDHATAAVGEVATRLDLSLFEAPGRALRLEADGGVRQSAATGFAVRDYAPREWAGSASLRYLQSVGGWGRLTTRMEVRGRSIHDRPPMPLFLQPGYLTASGSLGMVTRSFDGVSFDASIAGENADYRALELIPQLDLLDRRGVALVGGARWGTSSTVRIYGGVGWTEYPQQGSFDPADPFRRDRTVNAGVEWTHVGLMLVQLGLEGTWNRSNSNRPEYDALSFRALLNAPLPDRMSLNVFAVLTGKSYVHETDFARLVPGEEADNASIAYVQITRPLAVNLDGAVRLGWTRAETDVGNAYYRRFGASLQFNYRPR